MSDTDLTDATEPGEVAWITEQDVSDALGQPPAGEADRRWLTAVTSAANYWAFRKRQESGYALDEPDEAPSPDVKLGCVAYAVVLYRHRGAFDSSASFDIWPEPPIVSAGLGRVRSLLGIDRPVLA